MDDDFSHDDDDDDELDYEPLVFNLDQPDNDTMSSTEAIVGVDPFLEGFYRSQFDPIYSAQAFGRITGKLVEDPPGGGGMRLAAGVVGVAMLIIGALGVLYAITGDVMDDGDLAARLAGAGYALAFSLPFAIGGALLLWKLRRGGTGNREQGTVER